MGYGRRIAIKDLAAMICRMTESHSKIQHAPERVGDVKHSLANVEKLQAAGFEPAGDFERALAATIGFFRDQMIPEPCLS